MKVGQLLLSKLANFLPDARYYPGVLTASALNMQNTPTIYSSQFSIQESELAM